MTDRPPLCQIDSWEIAEENAAAWIRYWGYNDARVTQGGADGGVDVSSEDVLAQVKFEAHQVGTPALQRLVGARRNDHHKTLMFFTGAGYARPALEYANAMNIALFKYDLRGVMSPVNHRAEVVSVPNASPAMSAESSLADTRPSPAKAKKPGHGWWFRNWMMVLVGWWTFLLIRDLWNFSQSGDMRLGWGNFVAYLIATAIITGIWLALGAKRRQWKSDRDEYLARVQVANHASGDDRAT